MIGYRTRVTLEHRGFDRLPRDKADHVRRYSWTQVLGWFASHLAAPPDDPRPYGDTSIKGATRGEVSMSTS